MANTHLPQALMDLQARAGERPDFESQTSTQLHSDLYAYLERQQLSGNGVIEVGCHRGASSIVLAYACHQLRMQFYCVDIRRENLDYTRELFTSLVLPACGVFFHGTLSDFAAAVRLPARPLLLFIDADHRYAAVRKDIEAIWKCNCRPFAVAFHDFSLRSHRNSEILVDKAILDAFGDDVRYRPIGFQIASQPNYSRDKPARDGHYWEDNGSEGVIVELDSVAHSSV